MEEHGGRRWPLVVLASSPFHGHMTPTLQLAKALHAHGFSIAIAHSNLNPPNPSNHPSFIFLPLSDNLSTIDDSGSFRTVAVDLNLAAIVFRSSSAAYFPAYLVRQQLHQEGRFLEQGDGAKSSSPQLFGTPSKFSNMKP
ncbi:unnamed protein product [Lactuca virosa]|uniref:Glycosyltransferase n=1 Tax=Lactuca virosa TaxID=75947 RepID=A0AAU9P9H1_9ASTR|nr:unnamed protein product [Lactuca virosa]